LLLILPVWLLLACLVVAACRTAARGDVVMAQAVEQARRHATLAGVVVWGYETTDDAADDEPTAVRAPSRPGRGPPGPPVPPCAPGSRAGVKQRGRPLKGGGPTPELRPCALRPCYACPRQSVARGALTSRRCLEVDQGRAFLSLFENRADERLVVVFFD